MPINYMPQAPVAGAYASAYALQRAEQLAAARQRAASSGGGGGGGGGGGNYGFDPGDLVRLFSNDADRTQAAIANRDRQAFEGNKFAAELDQRPQLANLQAQNEAGLQDQRIAGQIALQNNELSQQEKIRYMRMKNSLGAIETDPSLTDEEKGAYRTQIQTGINPYEIRLAKTKLETQRIEKQAMADQYETHAKLNEQTAKLNAMTFDDRKAYNVEDPIIKQIKDDMMASLPMSELIPDAQLTKMAKDEAMRQGLGQTMYQVSPGKWAPLTPEKGEHGTSKGAGNPNHPSGLTPHEFLKELQDARKQAETEQTMKNENGQLVNPDQSVTWKQKRIQQILEESKLPANMEEFMAQSQTKGYKSPYGKELATAANTDKRTEFSTQAMDALGVEAQRIVTREDIDPTLKFQAAEAVQVARQIMRQYPNPDTMPKATRDKFDAAMKLYRSLPTDPRIAAGKKPLAGGNPASVSPYVYVEGKGVVRREDVGLPAAPGSTGGSGGLNIDVTGEGFRADKIDSQSIIDATLRNMNK